MMFHWQGNDIKLKHIESRTTQKGEDDLDFFVECGGVNGNVKNILKELNEKECIAKALGSSLVKEPEEGKIFLVSLLNGILKSKVVYIWHKQPQKYYNGKIKSDYHILFQSYRFAFKYNYYSSKIQIRLGIFSYLLEVLHDHYEVTQNTRDYAMLAIH